MVWDSTYVKLGIVWPEFTVYRYELLLCTEWRLEHCLQRMIEYYIDFALRRGELIKY